MTLPKNSSPGWQVCCGAHQQLFVKERNSTKTSKCMLDSSKLLDNGGVTWQCVFEAATFPFSRLDDWIITTHNTETAFLCLHGASLTRKKFGAPGLWLTAVDTREGRSYFTAYMASQAIQKYGLHLLTHVEFSHLNWWQHNMWSLTCDHLTTFPVLMDSVIKIPIDCWAGFKHFFSSMVLFCVA